METKFLLRTNQNEKHLVLNSCLQVSPLPPMGTEETAPPWLTRMRLGVESLQGNTPPLKITTDVLGEEHRIRSEHRKITVLIL